MIVGEVLDTGRVGKTLSFDRMGTTSTTVVFDANAALSLFSLGGQQVPSAPHALPWATRPGVKELSWLEENRQNLVNFAGLWIGVVGKNVVASAPSFEEVYANVSGRGLQDPLITYVPDDPGWWDYLIA